MHLKLYLSNGHKTGKTGPGVGPYKRQHAWSIVHQFLSNMSSLAQMLTYTKNSLVELSVEFPTKEKTNKRVLKMKKMIIL